MEKKNILKRVLAVICSAVLLVGSFSGYASNSKAADTMAVPEGLEDYTRLGAEAFGITEEVVHSGLGVWATYTANDVPSFDKRYLDVDLSWKGGNGTSVGDVIHYMGLDRYLIYVAWETFYIYDVQSGKALYQAPLATYVAAEGEYFNLKIASDIKTNASDSSKLDVTFKVWINNELVMPDAAASSTDSVTSTVSTASLTQSMTVSSGSATQTIKIKPHIYEVVEPEEPVVPEVPEGLENYTRITLDKFSGLEAAVGEAGTLYKANTEGTYIGQSLDNTYLDVDVNFNGSVNGSYFNYLHKADWSELVRIVHVGEGLSAYQHTNTSNSVWMGTAPNNTFFNMKLAVDIDENASDSSLSDITLQVWLEDSYQGKITLTARADELNNVYIAASETNTISFRTPLTGKVVETTLSDVSYELTSGEGYLLTGAGTLYVDDVETVAGTVLQTPGDYVVKRVTSAGEVYIQNVALYKLGDVSLGGEEAWADADYAALEKVISGSISSRAAKKAADINNDGKVSKIDLSLMKKVIDGELEKTAVVKKYHIPAVTYDFLGGDSVMPIGGYYGPYAQANITETVYKAIADSGVNLIVKSNLDYKNEGQQALIHKGLALAEKYGIGVYVSDARLNSIVTSGNIVTEHYYVSDRTEMADLLGDYSIYQSYLGNMIVDEPIANKEYGWKRWGENRRERFKWYEDITEALCSYDNLIGYVNLLGQYHMQQASGYKYIEYEDYLRSIGKSTKILSFDSYPFWEKDGVSGGLTPYLKSLGIISKVAREDGYPFWSYVQAGTDYRDPLADGSFDEGATRSTMTKAQTLWNVNTSLAFGAKGLVYFPLIQPTHFAYISTTEGTNDFNRNGIIGADNNKNTYYEWVQTANKQVEAVDEVLMKSLNQGVVVTGQAQTDTAEVESIITSTDRLTGVSGDDAMVGCFTYGDTEAFYVVSYDYAATEEQTITLTFDGSHQYRIIQAGATTYGEGTTCTITASAGEGVLVVLEDRVVYYEDISAYRAESGYTAPEAPAGYIFAGWYKDEACTRKNAVGQDETNVAAYAKFVDANLLTIQAQITAGTTENSEKTNIRFVTAVDSLKYKKVGFIIKIHKESGVDVRDRVDNIVYQTMNAMVGDTTWKYTPQELFCGTATHFKAWIIQNIPNASFDTEFEVTPYWETLDGTVVYGTTAIKTVRQGIQ